MKQEQLEGAIALAGSGEYLPQMNDVDLALMETLNGPTETQVALLPTASGLEPGMPERWNARGISHFEALGARVTPLHLVAREDAFDEDNLVIAARANFFYFSGGNPKYVVETLRDTPVWECIRRRHREGAVLAGCSAGAMMLGGYSLGLGGVLRGQRPEWVQALGVVPELTVLPHFDRIHRFVDEAHLREMIRNSPDGITVVGVDEDTALVRISDRWQVMGSKGVSVFSAEGDETRYHTGQTVPLATTISART